MSDEGGIFSTFLHWSRNRLVLFRLDRKINRGPRQEIDLFYFDPISATLDNIYKIGVRGTADLKYKKQIKI